MHEVQLEVERTSATYRQHLHDALLLLRHWIAGSHWDGIAWEEDASAASQLLCEHVQWLRDTGRPVSSARHAILSAQTSCRNLKGLLGRPWDCVKSWQLQKPLKSRTPMPHMVLQALLLM